jgi:maleate isomerase
MSAGNYRVGLMVPSSNVTMETELPLLFRRREETHPDGRFTFHSSRMRLKHVTPDELRAMNDDVGRCASELADASCDVVATACLVAIMAQGGGFHEKVEGDIAAVLGEEGADAPVVSSAGALIHALRTLDAKRIAIITPYVQSLTTLVADYIEACDVTVSDSLSLEVPDNLMVAQLDQEDLLAHWRKLDLDGCDALVLSACVQMPSLDVIATVESECGLPVLSAATATAFCILQSLGLRTEIEGAGGLLSGTFDRSKVALPGRS